MTRSRSLVLCVLLGACLPAGPAAADLWDGLEQGQHGVGFETRNVVDFTRAAGEDATVGQGRFVQLSIWFPTEVSPAVTEALSVRDYVALTAKEFAGAGETVTADARAQAQDSIADFPLNGIPAAVVTPVLNLRARARGGSQPAPGRFPLLIIAPGNHDPAWRHFLLAEYLASHGYIVVAFPSAVRRTRDEFDMSMSIAAFRDQLHDTAFALDYMTAEHASVDPDRIMLFGFSMGGNTGGLNLLRSHEVDGFVCLDCGIGSTWGTPSLNRRFDETFPGAADRPLAFIHISEGGERYDSSFIDRFQASYAYHSIVEGARHFDFTSLGAIAGEITGIEHERWLSPGPFAREVHNRSLALVRVFLDAHLKDDSSAAAALRSTEASDLVHVHRIVEPQR